MILGQPDWFSFGLIELGLIWFTTFLIKRYFWLKGMLDKHVIWSIFSNKFFFYVYEVKVMVEEIDLPIRKLLENTSLYPIIGQTKTKKLLLSWLKAKHNVTVLWDNIMQFFTRKTRGCNIFFNSANKEIFSVFSVPVIKWQEATMTVKKRSFTSVC